MPQVARALAYGNSSLGQLVYIWASQEAAAPIVNQAPQPAASRDRADSGHEIDSGYNRQVGATYEESNDGSANGDVAMPAPPGTVQLNAALG
jgi:hypothetical protein